MLASVLSPETLSAMALMAALELGKMMHIPEAKVFLSRRMVEVVDTFRSLAFSDGFAGTVQQSGVP